MGDFAAEFLHAIDLPLVDVLGFSIGGAVAQALTIRHPELVRRLLLLGTIPPHGDMTDADPKVLEVLAHPELTAEDFLFLFFGRSAAAQQAGRTFWERRHQRTVDVDPPTSPEVARPSTRRCRPGRSGPSGSVTPHWRRSPRPRWSLTATGTSCCRRSTPTPWPGTSRTPSSSSTPTQGTARSSSTRACSWRTRRSSSTPRTRSADQEPHAARITAAE